MDISGEHQNGEHTISFPASLELKWGIADVNHDITKTRITKEGTAVAAPGKKGPSLLCPLQSEA